MTSESLFMQQSIIKNDALIWVILYGLDPANTHENNFMQNSFYAELHRNIQAYINVQRKMNF